MEVAAAFSEIHNRALRDEFPELDFSQAKITVLEAGEALLSAFHPKLQRAALRMLTKRGADVRFRSQVSEVGPASVTLADGSEIAAGTVVWATGVRATPLADALGVPQGQGGRVLVSANLSLAGHPDVFAIGDMVQVRGSDPLPGVAPVAMQQGRYVGRVLRDRARGRTSPPFRYRDKGNLATIGRSRAVADVKGVHVAGFPAWVVWLGVHLFYLIGFQNRLLVLLRWTISFVTHGRGARLITGPVPRGTDVARPRE